MALSAAMDAVDATPTAPACENCAATEGKLQKCSACRSARYCGRACQREDWKNHQKTCRARAKRCQDARARTSAIRDKVCVVCEGEVTVPPPHSHEFACGHKAHISCHEKRAETDCARCGAFGAPVTAEVSDALLRKTDGTPLDREGLMAALLALRTPWYEDEDPMSLVRSMLGYIFQTEKTQRTGTDGTLADELEFIRVHIEAIPDPDDFKKVLAKYQRMARGLMPRIKELVASGTRTVRTKHLPEDLAPDLQTLRRGLSVTLAIPFVSGGKGTRPECMEFIPTFLRTMGL